MSVLGTVATVAGNYLASSDDDESESEMEKTSRWKRRMAEKYQGPGQAIGGLLSTQSMLSGRPPGNQWDANAAGMKARYSGNIRGSDFRSRSQPTYDAAYEAKLAPNPGDLLALIYTGLFVAQNLPELQQQIQQGISGVNQGVENVKKTFGQATEPIAKLLKG
jgi:hypothetical protein